MSRERVVTLRRMIQQTKHCVEEALAIVERSEDARCAIDDLEQAGLLIGKCLKDARDYARAKGDLR